MDKHQIEISARICPSFKTSPGVLVNGSQQIIAGNYLFSYPKHVIQGSEQKIAYKALINRLLSAFRDGYNCTLLAYGQTGSGKTYSMFGPTGSLTESSLAQSNEGIPEDWGVLPRTMLNILNENSSFGTMYVSAIEVYVNTAYDLLNGRCALKVGGTRTKEAPHYAGVDKHGDVEVHPSYCDCHKCFVRKNKVKNSNNFERQSNSNLLQSSSSTNERERFQAYGEIRWHIKTPADVAKLARTIEMTRSATGHLLNERSSRSHCLVSLYLSHKSINSKLTERQFLFVDLGGSERIQKSGVTGSHANEAMAINSSLTTLGRVIKSLSTPGVQTSHIPYRDSTLTMLLASAFGGKSCTSVLINISADQDHLNETICSLQFGERLLAVKNKASVVTEADINNELFAVRFQQAALIKELGILEANGHGERFASTAPISEQKTFNDNVNKHKCFVNEARFYQTQITEELGKGMVKNGSKHEALVDKYHKAQFQADNLRDIIERQKSIKGFWYPATSRFMKKKAELNDVETRLKQLENVS